MAGIEDLYSQLLAQQAQKEIAAANPYIGLGNTVDSIGGLITQSAGTGQFKPKETIIASALAGLLSGGLSSKAADYQNTLTDRFTNYTGNLLKGNNVSADLAPNLLKAGKESANLFRLQNQLNEQQGKQELRDSAQKQFIIKSFENPYMAKKGLSVANSILKSQGINPILADGEVDTSIAAPTGQASELDTLIEQTGGDVNLAGELLKQKQKATLEQSIKEDAKLSELRDSTAKTRKTLEELDNAISGAGNTGGLPGADTARELGLKLGNTLGFNEGEKLANRKVLETIGLDFAAEMRKNFPGQVSNAEMQLYLKATPGTSNTAEQNKALRDKFLRLQQTAEQKLTFLETAKANGIPMPKAEELFTKLDSAVPLFTKTKTGLEINPARSQLDFSTFGIDDFQQLASIPTKNLQAVNQEQTRKAQGVDLGVTPTTRADLSSAIDVESIKSQYNALRAQGLSKEQAAEKLGL